MKKGAWGEVVQDRDEQYRLKRQALLHTAAQAFNESGFHQTSLNDLAKKLKVTKPTLYYYIKNKDDILFECQRMALEHMKDAYEATQSSHKTGLEKLRMLLTRYAELITDDFGKCLVLSGIHALEPESQAALMADRRELDDSVRGIIRQGIEDGSIAPCDPKLVTFALFGAFNWIAHWHREDNDMTPQEIAAQFLSLFESGLVPRKNS